MFRCVLSFSATLAKRWKVQFRLGLAINSTTLILITAYKYPKNTILNKQNQLWTSIEKTKIYVLPLVPTCPQPGNFYTIPKIHKLSRIVKQFFTEQGNQLHVDDINDIITLAKDLQFFPPGRPIVSGIGTLTENISGFIDYILQRQKLFIPSYIKDTTEFMNKLASIKTIPSDVLLVTMDVTSLYSIFLMSTEWMPVLNSSMITVLPIFVLKFYVLSYHSF